MRNIQKIGALNFAVCQLVANLVESFDEFLLDRDLHDHIPRIGLDIKMTRFIDNQAVGYGPFKGQVAKFCRVIIMPANWEADELIECIFFRLERGKDKSWWSLRGLLSARNTHQEFWCQPNTLSGQTEFYRNIDQIVHQL